MKGETSDMSYAKIRPRRGTLYEWTTVNPVLYEGEFVLEVPDTGVGTGLSKFKIGDGVTAYADLPYAFDGASAAAINGGGVSSSHTIQIRSGTYEEWALTNPVLEENEISYDTRFNAIKIGDGGTKWLDLPYIASGSTFENNYNFGYEDEDIILPEDPELQRLTSATLNDLLNELSRDENSTEWEDDEPEEPPIVPPVEPEPQEPTDIEEGSSTEEEQPGEEDPGNNPNPGEEEIPGEDDINENEEIPEQDEGGTS